MTFHSNFTKKLGHIAIALILALGVGLATTQNAEAGRRGNVAVGIGLGIIGAAIIASQSRRAHGYDGYERARCYKGPKRCGWVGNRRCWENRWGEVRCRGGRYRCWRERYCD